MWQNIACVAIGGSIGAVLRYSISTWVLLRWPCTFPWGTLIVNVLGCFVMGWVANATASANWPVSFRLLVTTGLLGALTTFSTFSLETLRLWQHQQQALAAISIAANMSLSLIAVVAGAGLAKWLTAGG